MTGKRYLGTWSPLLFLYRICPKPFEEMQISLVGNGKRIRSTSLPCRRKRQLMYWIKNPGVAWMARRPAAYILVTTECAMTNGGVNQFISGSAIWAPKYPSGTERRRPPRRRGGWRPNNDWKKMDGPKSREHEKCCPIFLQNFKIISHVAHWLDSMRTNIGYTLK